MASKVLASVWDDHNAAEFATKDADMALSTMVEEPYVTMLRVREAEAQLVNELILANDAVQVGLLDL